MFLGVMVKIQNFIERTFHDEIVAVEEPREWWIEYKDIGKRLEGYIIPVAYKYRGKKNEYSCIDNDHFCLVSPEQALKCAKKFYSDTLNQIKSRHEKTK